MHGVCACSYLCMHLPHTYLSPVCMQLGVCLSRSVCQGVEESSTHVLGRRQCVWVEGCVQSRILFISPSLSVSRSHYCVVVTLLPLKLLPIVTRFNRSNADPYWRHNVRYSGVHTSRKHTWSMCLCNTDVCTSGWSNRMIRKNTLKLLSGTLNLCCLYGHCALRCLTIKTKVMCPYSLATWKASTCPDLKIPGPRPVFTSARNSLTIREFLTESYILSMAVECAVRLIWLQVLVQ